MRKQRPRAVAALVLTVLLCAATSGTSVASGATVDACMGQKLGDVIMQVGQANAAQVDRDNHSMAEVTRQPAPPPTQWRFTAAQSASAYYEPIIDRLKSCAGNSGVSTSQLIERYLTFAYASAMYAEVLAHFHAYSKARTNADVAIRTTKTIGKYVATDVPYNPVTKLVQTIIQAATAVERELPQ